MKAIIHSSTLIVLMLFASSASAIAFYVQSVKAPIMSKPSFSATKLTEAKKGDTVSQLEVKGYWRKVNYKGKVGWISKLLVSTRKPAGRISVLERSGENLQTGARRRASQFTTAAAARGFAEDRARVSDKYKINFAGVEKMESIKISDEVAMAFLLEGVSK